MPQGLCYTYFEVHSLFFRPSNPIQSLHECPKDKFLFPAPLLLIVSINILVSTNRCWENIQKINVVGEFFPDHVNFRRCRCSSCAGLFFWDENCVIPVLIPAW